MSANIHWRPVSKRAGDVPTSLPSSFIQSMEKAFGSQPWRLVESDIPVLKGMAATTNVDAFESDPYSFMISKIEATGEIEVWPEY